MKEIFTHVNGKWRCDFNELATKTNKMFALLEVKRVFQMHKEIKVVDVAEGENYVNVLILTTGICYELLFIKDTKEIHVNSISARAIERINKSLATL